MVARSRLVAWTLVGLLVAVSWFTMTKLERHFNPANFDLKMQQQIQENDILAKKGLEVWKEQKGIK